MNLIQYSTHENVTLIADKATAGYEKTLCKISPNSDGTHTTISALSKVATKPFS